MPKSTPTTANQAESARLTIDLGAIAENWRRLNARAAPAEVGAVVKADAYGLGLAAVAPTLHAAGARRFYVAQVEEGVALRALLPDTQITVMAPAWPEAATLARAHRLRLAINSRADLEQWRAEATGRDAPLPAQLHIDSGMTRLGVDDDDVAIVWRSLSEAERRAVTEVASHLACADDPADPANARQLNRFLAATAALPGLVSRSLANSSGMFLGDAFLQDVARPGMALYGLNPTPGRANPMTAAVRLDARVLQVRELKREEVVGYGATVTAPAGARLATIAAGYADGLHRALVGTGAVFVAGRRAPMLGRVSMDLNVADVSDVPEQLCRPGDFVEVIGPNQTADDLAAAAGTIGYEILTSLGGRFRRSYIGGSA